MGWTQQETDRETRFRLASGWRLGSVFWVPFALLFLGVFGPGFLAVGTLELRVECRRAGEPLTTTCSITEGYLLGLVPFSREVRGATGIEFSSARGQRGVALSGLVLTTSSGEPVRLLSLSSNSNSDEKREVFRALKTFFEGQEPEVSVRVIFWSPFGLFGVPFTLLWLFAIWSTLNAPFQILYPPEVLVDSRARVVRLRLTPGPRRLREVRLSELSALEASRDPGGWLGRLANRPGDARPAPQTAGPLHLHFVLGSGERLVLRNFARITDDELHALRQAVAAATGAPTP